MQQRPQSVASATDALTQANDLLNGVEYKLRQLRSLGKVLESKGGESAEPVENDDVALFGSVIVDLAESIREDAETANVRIRDYYSGQAQSAGGAR